MKAFKTIIVTAVVVLGLSTVAVAGAQRLGAASDDGLGAAQAQAAPAQPAAPGSVTLTAAQFDALLGALHADGSTTAAHARLATHAGRQAHQQAGRAHRAVDATRPAITPHTATHLAAAHHSTTHHAATHHTTTHHATTHHTTTHHAETHGGGDHDGGCD